MSIDKYLEGVESLITSFSIVTAHTLTIDRKTQDIAFITGVIEFRNGAMLDFKEFLESKGNNLEKYMYAYNYRMQSEVLFRYDNAPDPRARELKTFPDHKHLQGGKIIETERPGLSDVLKEIDNLYSIHED